MDNTKIFYNIDNLYDVIMFFNKEKPDYIITYNILNRNTGEYIFDNNIYYISPIRENKIIIGLDENKFIFMSKKLKRYIPKNKLGYFYSTSYFDKGIAAVSDDTGYYHINNKLEQLYKNRYDKVYNYKNKLAVAFKDGKAFHINMKGEPAYEYRYDNVENFVNGYAVARVKDKFFHIHPNGIPAYENRFDYLEDFDDYGLAYCRKGVYHCFINTIGDIMYKSVSYNKLLSERFD